MPAAGADEDGRKMRTVCIVLFLGLNAWRDARRREISLISAAIFGAAGLLFCVCRGGSIWQRMVSLVIAGCFLGLSVLTRGEIGMGDGVLLAALGTVLDVEEFLTMLLLGLLGSSIWALVLLAVFRKGRKTEIPFVPFLLLGYLGGILLC